MAPVAHGPGDHWWQEEGDGCCALTGRIKDLLVCQCLHGGARSPHFDSMDPNDEEQMEVDGNHAASVDSTSDSDDSEFEEIDVSIENMALITKLETDLEANPNLYDVHLQVPLQFHDLFVSGTCLSYIRRYVRRLDQVSEVEERPVTS